MKKEMKIALAVLAVVVLALVVYFASRQTTTQTGEEGRGADGQTVAGDLQELEPEAAEATSALIEEVAEKNEGNVQTIALPSTATTTNENGEVVPVVEEMKVVVVAPGTSGIDVDSGKVVKADGTTVNNAAQAATGDAPQSSFPISKEDLPSSTIKLDVTSSSFTPKEFTVKKGQAVSLAVTNVNTSTFSEVFRFDDPDLSGVVIGLAKGETKSITFNAPTKAGEYTFYSSMFDHREQGAVGKMIVQ